MSAKRASFSLHPDWPHYLSLGVTVLAIFVGLLRWLVIDQIDSMRCNSMLQEGQWLDDQFRNWQPNGCMLRTYNDEQSSSCLRGRDLVFAGDSTTRQLFFRLLNTMSSQAPSAPPDDGEKHADHHYIVGQDTKLSFYWDPFLNSSSVAEFIHPPTNTAHSKPALLVLGTGLWYLRYPESSGGLPAWESRIEASFEALAKAYPNAADHAVFLPVENIVSSKLAPERAATMHESDVDAMNSDLAHRVRLLPRTSWFSSASPIISVPEVFNLMLDSSETSDGLHFSPILIQSQVNLLLNLACNDALPKVFPYEPTCCRRYPTPGFWEMLIIGIAVLWTPVSLYRTRKAGVSLEQKKMSTGLVFGVGVGLIFVADRTGLWLKEQKQYEPLTFAFLCLLALGLGMSTMKRADKDLGFLNREQTDEWKGWMQLAILIYHYCGASKISGIYNAIRILVAAYLFMTGFGHTTYYIRKADFGFHRIAQVLIRINLLTVLLAYTMNTDYISYYFSPLVSWWFLIIYCTMAIGRRFNDRTYFLVVKIMVSAGISTLFMNHLWLLEVLFTFLERTCGIHWSAKEWQFRVILDMWIVYFGMLAAIIAIKIRERRLTEHPYWMTLVRVSSAASAFVMLWFFVFEVRQESKFTYNKWHPYISCLPIFAFVVLRNATSVLRSMNSRAFAFVGQCSLETFIIQFHLWLAADSKGLLLVVPGTRWRPLNLVVTTIMFVYISHRVANATGDLTAMICGSASDKLPQSRRSGPNPTNAQESIPLNALSPAEDSEGNEETPTSPQRHGYWFLIVKRGSRLGLPGRIALFTVVVWFVNVTWPSP